MSFELAPIIKIDSATDKVNNKLFHPGIMSRRESKSTFAFMTRLAFETIGRYGITPIFNKVVISMPNIKYLLLCHFLLVLVMKYPYQFALHCNWEFPSNLKIFDINYK